MHAKFKLRVFIFDFFLLSDLYVFDLLENASLVIGVVIWLLKFDTDNYVIWRMQCFESIF